MLLNSLVVKTQFDVFIFNFNFSNTFSPVNFFLKTKTGFIEIFFIPIVCQNLEIKITSIRFKIRIKIFVFYFDFVSRNYDSIFYNFNCLLKF